MVERRHVLVVGGGPAAIETMLALRALSDAFELELLTPGAELVLPPYEVLTPFHEGHERRYSLARIASDLRATLTHGALATVYPERRLVRTLAGDELQYDRLVIAVGAKRVVSVPGATLFRGARDAQPLKSLLIESRAGRHRRIAFVVPPGITWPLPIYELALHTAEWMADRGITSVPLTIVSAESGPLDLFGAEASREVADLLEAGGIAFHHGHAVRHRHGRLLLVGGEVDADLAIALPRYEGPGIIGLPGDAHGFLPVDHFGRVAGTDDVFAAGDVTTHVLKQGGLATQQADAIAEWIAADAGIAIEPRPYRPALRALLYAGEKRRMVSTEGIGPDAVSTVSAPPPSAVVSKLIARHLTPYLGSLEAELTAFGARDAAGAEASV